MKVLLCLLGLVAATQAFLQLDGGGSFCLACCGPTSQGCCNTCGLTGPGIFDPLTTDPLHQGGIVAKRRVVSTKSFIDDLNHGLNGLIPDFDNGPDSACLDCCGPHPCCGKCGIDSSIFGHHYPDITGIDGLLGHHGSTAEPQSPEKGTYGTGTDGSDILGGYHPINHLGPIDSLPPIDPIAPIDPMAPAHAYYENVDQ